MPIELRNVSKMSEGSQYLKGLNMTIEDGTFLSVVAPTGTGKTTLLRVMAGIEKPDAGQIFVNGEDVTKTHVRDRNIAMVYQQFINYPSLSVFENIASPLRVSGKMPAKEIDHRVRTVAEQLQIAEFLERIPQELSGGQQQRVAIARALVKDANMVLLDEPLGNLDYKLREDLRIELKNLAAERNSIFVYATPEPIDALMMASHVAIMYDGDIIQYGPMEDVYLRPNHVKSGAFFSEPPMNFLDCEVSNGQAVVGGALKIPLKLMDTSLDPGQYTLGIRPHHINMGSEIDETPDGIRLNAQVDLAEVVGSDLTMHLHHNDLNFIALSRDFTHFELDQDVEVAFDPRHIYVFDPDNGALIESAAEVR